MAQTIASVASVSAVTSATTLFASTLGADAAGRLVFNDSTADLYLKFGSGATSSDFTVKIPAGGYWEAPPPVYDGLITGVWSAVNGSARCTQVSP